MRKFDVGKPFKLTDRNLDRKMAYFLIEKMDESLAALMIEWMFE